MNISRRNSRWVLNTEKTIYLNDSFIGFLADCRRALFTWLAK